MREFKWAEAPAGQIRPADVTRVSGLAGDYWVLHVRENEDDRLIVHLQGYLTGQYVDIDIHKESTLSVKCLSHKDVLNRVPLPRSYFYCVLLDRSLQGIYQEPSWEVPSIEIAYTPRSKERRDGETRTEWINRVRSYQ